MMDGGFGPTGIKVENTTLEKEVQAEMAGEERGVEQASELAAQTEVNAVLIEAISTVVGRTLALLTAVEEMNFDEQEIQQLIKIWTPVTPTISPMAVALLGTTAILSSKVAIYVAFRKKEKERRDVWKQRGSIPGGADRATRTGEEPASFIQDSDAADLKTSCSH